MARTKRANGDEPAEELWDLPNGWKWTALDEVGRWGSGGTPKANEVRFYDGPIPWVRSGELDKGRIQSTEKTLTEFGLENSSAKWVPELSLLVALYGANIGQTAITGIRCTTNQAVAFCVPNETADVSYLFRYVQFIKRRLCELGQGGAQHNISQAILRAHPIPLPPIRTQRRIASRIDELFAEIDDGERAVADSRAGLDTYRKSLLDAAVTGELTADWRSNSDIGTSANDFVSRLGKHCRRTPQSDRIAPFEIPNRWRWTTVGEIGDVTGGLTQNSKREALPIKRPFLRVANVYAGRLDLDNVEFIGVREEEIERALLRLNDLLIVEGNGSISQIGRAALWDASIPHCLHQNHLIKVRFIDPSVAHWVRQWLQSPRGRLELEERASSTSGLHTLSISKVQSLRCPIPPPDEISVIQKTIEARSSEADGGLRGMVESESSAASLRQSILSAAFRGELVS